MEPIITDPPLSPSLEVFWALHFWGEFGVSGLRSPEAIGLWFALC